MIRKKEMNLSEIINNICELYKTKGENGIYLDNDWCVYSSENEISAETKCYVDEYPEFDEDDNEIYSDFIRNNNLELLFRDEMIQDVIIASLNQKSNATIEEIIKALLYYEEHDTFLVL